MRAVYYEAFQTPPVIANLPDPTPAPRGVVVKVEATGLCRSDWHGWMGHDADIHLPHVPGHELAGTIVALGRAVKTFKVGERVTVPFVAGCGHCEQCGAGHPQVCEHQFQPGFTAWGSFAGYVALDFADDNLVRLPDDMSFDTAAALGCRFATSFRAVADQAKLRHGEFFAVHGCGGVGLSALMIGKALGGIGIAVDIDEAKLALAKASGAGFTIDARTTPDVAGAIREITKGGAQVSIDALGSARTSFNSVMSLRRRGRHVQVGLMTGKDAEAPMPMARVIAHELEIYGSHGIQASRYGAIFDMIATGQLAPQRLITQHISLDAAPAALMAMDSFPPTGITMIRP